MERRKIVAGNWKMNLTWVEAFDLAHAIKENSIDIESVEKIIFPPFPYLQMLAVMFEEVDNFFIGAQNCSEHANGAYTGEVAASMIESAGSNYILVGHSERREYFAESAKQMRAKIEQCLTNSLNVIFCFGEKLEERKNSLQFETVEKQLKDVLKDFPITKVQNLVLAYEPVWAIGTGETATPAQAQEMHAFVRKTIANLFSEQIASEIPILYGGSCNAKNAKELFAGEDVDGGLIGGASLKADDFCTIMKSFS